MPSPLALKLKKAVLQPDRVVSFVKRKANLLPYYMSKEGYSAYPTTLFLSVNSLCNLHCKMCDIGTQTEESTFFKNLNRGNRSELDLGRMKQLVDEVAAFRPVLALISTEPLLWKPVVEFVEYASSRGLRVQLTTNGLRLPQLAEDLVEAGLDSLWVSLDGPAAVHNEIRGNPKSFEKATEGLGLVQEARARRRGRNPSSISLNFSISNLNYPYLVDFVDAVADVEADLIQFSHLNFVTHKMAAQHNHHFGKEYPATPTTIHGVDPTQVEPELLADQIATIRRRHPLLCQFSPDISTADEVRDFYNNPGRVLARDRCLVVWEVAQILADGVLTPITRCFECNLGNIYDDTFEALWNGPRMRAFRKLLRAEKLTPACTRCCAVL